MMEKLIVDVHAHILPGIDDGAKDWEESLRMIDMAVSMGIRTIIATPHFSRYIDPNEVRELAQRLGKEVQKKYPEFKIYPGQEILYFDSIVEVLKEGAALTLADSRYVLVEFMPEVSYQKLYQGVCKILRGGYYPVVAHVERYGCLRRKECLEELLKTDCLLQMNFSSLKGRWFDADVRWCRRQVLNNRIHFLGTDMHREAWRSPNVENSLSWLEQHIEPEDLIRFTHDYGEKLLQSGQSEKSVKVKIQKVEKGRRNGKSI